MMSLDTSLIYHLNPDQASQVFQKIGADYENVVVEPTLRSAIREATASHTANALYTGEREMVAKQIFEQVNEQLTKRGLTVENVLLRDIQLPATLKASSHKASRHHCLNGKASRPLKIWPRAPTQK